MEILLPLLTFALGLALGLGLMYWRARDAANHQAALQNQMQAQMQDSFKALSLDALNASSEQFLKVAETRLNQQSESGKQHLDGKKQLIDQTLTAMKSELGKVNEMVNTIEKDRKAKFDVLSEKIAETATETRKLRNTTDELNAALTNSRVRGQWGDRMAEDILRLAGFVEGVNYQKQALLGAGEHAANRPDYTFSLPGNRVVHMDVKFPLDNYLKFLNAEDDHQRTTSQKAFISDVKNRIKEAASRGYVGEAGETLDYVLVFIPNEQVYAFLHEQDQSILDDALSKKVILCSPMTLYAVLAVIRQAVDNFKLERTAGQILGLLAEFDGQWDKFTGAMTKVGDKINAAQKEYDALTTTRANMLERPLRKIDALRKQENTPTLPAQNQKTPLNNIPDTDEETLPLQ